MKYRQCIVDKQIIMIKLSKSGWFWSQLNRYHPTLRIPHGPFKTEDLAIENFRNSK